MFRIVRQSERTLGRAATALLRRHAASCSYSAVLGEEVAVRAIGRGANPAIFASHSPAYQALQQLKFSTETTKDKAAEEEASEETTASKAAEEEDHAAAEEEEDASGSEEVSELKSKCEALEATVAKMGGENADYKDKLIRTLADMENLRERTSRQVENSQKFAIQGFVKDLLDVSDNLERALAAVDADYLESGGGEDGGEGEKKAFQVLKSLHEGIEMTEKQMLSVLKKNGVERFDPTDQPFDPNLHEARFEVRKPLPAPSPSPACPPSFSFDRSHLSLSLSLSLLFCIRCLCPTRNLAQLLW